MFSGYDGIPNKVSEETDPKYFQEYKPQLAKKAAYKGNVAPPPLPPPVSAAMKKQAKSQSSQTRDFINEMRKQNKQSKKDEIEIYGSSGKNDLDDQTQKAIEESLLVTQGKSAEEKQSVSQINTSQDDIKTSENQKIETQEITNTRSGLENNLKENQEQSTTTKQLKQESQAPSNTQSDEKLQTEIQNKPQEEPSQQSSLNVEEDREKYFAYVEEKSKQHNEECDKQIREYLKDGENVYQLFSILIHSGGAMGGHYFAFTKSFDSGKWFCFNDSSVTGIDPTEIPKRTFGGQGNNCAYMLFYRKVDQNNQQSSYQQWGGQFTEEDLPQKIQERINEERKKIQEQLEQGVTAEELALGTKQMTIKVHFKLEVKLLHVESSDKFKDLQEMAFKEYQIKDRLNCRLRGYVPHTDTLTDSYTGKENQTLQSLKIQCYKNMGFEFKTVDEEWSHYDSNVINVRYTKWEPNLQSLQEKQLKIVKIQARKNMTMVEFEQLLKEKEGMKLITIIKYHMDYGIEYAEIINNKDSKMVNLESIQENQLFFIEETILDNQGQIQSKWTKEFDNELHRITIKFNSPNEKVAEPEKEGQPNDEFPYSIVIDNRLPMSELKKQMCDTLKLQVQDVILRRNGRAGLELKDMSIEIGLNHFVKANCLLGIQHLC